MAKPSTKAKAVKVRNMIIPLLVVPLRAENGEFAGFHPRDYYRFHMNTNYVLPITIVIAGVIIAGAVFFVGKTSTPGDTTPDGTVTARPYDPATDHILGNPNAAVKVVEYMDLECPHCKIFE